MIIRIRLITFFVLAFGLVPGARAQYIWHVTHSDKIGKYTYAPTAIDCYGQTCIVATVRTDDSIAEYLYTHRDSVGPEPFIRIVFLRSDDGGQTWTEQDPGLPGLFDTQQNQINVIQQIDSLDAIACGDSSLIVRTSDGGKTWEQQHLDSANHLILSVHFSDPMTGIMTHGDYVHQVSITTDGGEHWAGVLLPEPYVYVACHSYGSGSFSVMNGIYNRIYSTHDYWNTVDSSSSIVSLNTDSEVDQLNYCDFSSGDTMIAYGQRSFGSNGAFDSSAKIVVRTTDAGATWVENVLPFITPVSIVSMTPLDRDTVFSSGGASGGMILESVDHGATWFQDTVVLDTVFADTYTYYPGITVTGDGHAIALILPFDMQNLQGIIVRREQVSAGVAENIPVVQSEQIYPNPFTESTEITFTSPTSGYAEVSIVNMLGVEVARLFSGELGAGEHSFSWSNSADLPDGTYECLVRMNGQVQTLPVVLMK